jgi:hypothetical protein
MKHTLSTGISYETKIVFVDYPIGDTSVFLLPSRPSLSPSFSFVMLSAISLPAPLSVLPAEKRLNWLSCGQPSQIEVQLS